MCGKKADSALEGESRFIDAAHQLTPKKVDTPGWV
jgi:hypothetical protein